ncbi:MAG: MerR family transcriptional regulator [Chitinophagales bacterium]
MANYSIKEIEHLSGVKAHTIRIWEQRYHVVDPKRTDTNIRYYTDEDLKLILNIALLNKQGIRIGTIARMNTPEMLRKINSLSSVVAKYELQINELIGSMIEIDEAKFEKIMLTNILQYGFEDTMLKVIYPFLEKIGIMWMTGNINPAQEHFISNLIRQKIIVAIDGQVYNPQLSSKKYLLYLPDGELHELSLLFLCYLLKARNNKVTYLGASVPVQDVLSVVEHYQPDYVYTILTSAPATSELEEYIRSLAEKLYPVKLLISGQRIQDVSFDLPSNVLVLGKMDEIVGFLDGES